jgi:transposase-like protein
LVKVGSELIWVWLAIEPENGQILAPSISKERNMFIIERVLDSLINNHGKHRVSNDSDTWNPMVCRFLVLEILSPFLVLEKYNQKNDAVYKGQK